jgi:hypothetical protein
MNFGGWAIEHGLFKYIRLMWPDDKGGYIRSDDG